MSLGPPFDGSPSGDRWVLGAGATTVVSLLAAVGFALLASDRTLGESFTIKIMTRSPGALHTGAQVRMAGRQIGEVVAIRGAYAIGPGATGATVSAADSAPPPAVEIEAHILRSWQPYIYRNATFFASTPNILTEAVLEVGPPPAGLEPQAPVADNARVRGADPADIDRFLQKIYLNLQAIRALSDDLGPDWAVFHQQVGHLIDSANALAAPGQVARIGVQATQALVSARALSATLRDADAVPRVKSLASDLTGKLAALDPDLRHMSAQLAAIDNHLSGITKTLGPQQRAQVEAAVATYRDVLLTADQMSRDLRWLLSYVERGRGTLGAFSNDITLFDDLKEVHRELKHQSYKLLIKSKDRGQRQIR